VTIVEGTALGGGLITLDKQYNRRFFSRELATVTKKRTLFRRGEKAILPAFSFLGQCADAWNLLDQATKDSWETAALVSGLSGYNLFIQDKTWRLMFDISGNAGPNIYHQYLIGRVFVPPDVGIFHLIKSGNQILSFPANIKISYRSILKANNGGGEYIKVRFSYVYDSGGGETWQSDELTLSTSSAWTSETLAITENTNPTGVWRLEIEGNNVKGAFYFDNFYVQDEAGIITNDPWCEQIEKKFNGIIIPEDVTFETMYPPDSWAEFNPPHGFLLNGKIVPSVASSNLTIALKTMAGDDPSENEPVYVRIGDVSRAITAPLSVTKNAGTNYFSSGNANMGLATNEVDYFVYLGYNATDGIVVGFARMPWGRKYSDFDTTAANSKYCAISTITNAAANDYYTVIGRFAATLSASASYNWSIPTFTALNLIQQPIYETRLLTFTSTWYGGSTQGSWIETYKIIGSQMHLNIASVSEITSNQNYLYTYIPMEPKITQVGIPIYVQDNSSLVAAPGHVELITNDVTLSFYKGFFRTAWTAANYKAVYMPTLVFPLYQL
jgi:hypothetical protein